MRYMGSKSRHAKELLQYILPSRQKGAWWVEPFAGGFNMTIHVEGPRIANDIDFWITSLFKALQGGWEPPDSVSEELYKSIQNNKTAYPPELVGFVGYGCSYAGKFFGGYARGLSAKGFPRNYCSESKRNVLKQAALLQEVSIFNVSYDTLSFPENSIIYCDPPYAAKTSYSNSFDSEAFWNWALAVGEVCPLFVSAYAAPAEMICVWEKPVYCYLPNQKYFQSVEKLFVHPRWHLTH